MSQSAKSPRSPKSARASAPAFPGGGAIGKVLALLSDAKRTRSGWSARCPAHDDAQASLSVGVATDGRVLLKCFAGCRTEAIVSRLGLSLEDLFDGNRRRRPAREAGIPPVSTATVQPSGHMPGLTLAQYAEAKRLPVDFLHRLGLRHCKYQGAPAVRIPYLDAQGSEVAVRFRIALEAQSRFRWKSGTKPCLYGLDRLGQARATGYVVLCEGESDAQTLWLHDIRALGLPGAASWQERWADHLDGIPIIYVIVEPDQGGQAVREWLSKSATRDRVRLVCLQNAKDPSALFLADPHRFKERWQAAIEASTPWVEEEQRDADERAERLWAECEALAWQPRILDAFAEELERAGVAGEIRTAKLTYLVVTSRLLARPVSLAVKGPSSGGKSYLVQQVLEFIPPSAYYALSGMSEHALAYSDEPLRHRMMVIYEAAGLQGDFGPYLMRSLLSEGKVRYETVEQVEGKMQSRLIEREGPTGLILTTTAVRLHPENETRLISVTVNDTTEQTRNVLRALAEEGREPVDYAPWHALQEWLTMADNRVTIPFAAGLAEAVPPVAVRLRRDFSAVLGLIRAHAMLHQAQRRRDDQSCIVASLDDYAAVRELVYDLVADGVEATVPATMRATVEAVQKLGVQEDSGVTVTAVARELHLDKSAAHRRVRTAVDRGYLKNLETRKGHPAQLRVGDPLPDEIEVLPSPDTLSGCTGCTVAADSEGIVALSPPNVPPADWPEPWREAYEERVAIMMVEGGLTAEDARQQALECVRREFAI